MDEQPSTKNPAEMDLKDDEVDQLLDEIHGTQAKNAKPQRPAADADDVDWNAIVKAIQAHNTAFIKKKITTGDVEVNARNPANGQTLLIYAVIVGDLDLVTTVCNFGADVKIKDDQGLDAFDYAVKFGRYKITELVFYRTLSGSLGNDLKHISQVLHVRNKEAAYMMKTAVHVRVGQRELGGNVGMTTPLLAIHNFMIRAIRDRAEFDESMLYYAWYYVMNAEELETKKWGPFYSDLWKTMMQTYESILRNTDDTQGWEWLKKHFVSSYIWHLPHPAYVSADAIGTGNGEYDATLKNTLFWELLHRVHTENKKQSDLLLKERIDNIKKDSADDWSALVAFDVDIDKTGDVDAKGARQDTCGCITPTHSELELSETRYPPSTHFSAKKHYDTQIYLNELLFRGNILNKEFQREVKAVTKSIGETIGVNVAYRAGPVKTLTRCQAKVENEYITEAYPTSAKILDINRCSLQFVNIKDMLSFLEKFVTTVQDGHAGCLAEVVRCKNGWKVYNEEQPAYTDIKLNVLVRSQADRRTAIVTEIQFLLILMSSFKKKAHKLYSVERKFELAYNYELNVNQTMVKFQDVPTDEHAMLKNLIARDEFDCFDLFWTSANISFPSLLKVKTKVGEHAIVCALLLESDKFHAYFMRHAKQRYAEFLLCLINQRQDFMKQNRLFPSYRALNHNVWQDFMQELETDALRLRFTQRLLQALSVKEAFDDSIDDAFSKLRARNLFKGQFDTEMSRYLSDGQLRAPKSEIDDFEFAKQTQLKFIQFRTELYVAGGESTSGVLGLGLNNWLAMRDPHLLNVCDKSMLQISCGHTHNLAVDVHGNMYAWGNGLGLGLGDAETRRKLPQKLPPFSEHKVVKVVAGGHTSAHSLALTEDGSVYSWGYAYSGQLGHGNQENVLAPKRIEAFSKSGVRIADIAAGHHHSGAVSKDGKLFMWGHNGYGRCARDPNAHKQLFEPTGITLDDKTLVPARVECGNTHSLVLTRNGKVLSCGDGNGGRLGHGDTESQPMAKLIDGLSDKVVVGLACGEKQSLCVTDDGELYSWGHNGYGQLGHGPTDDRIKQQLTPMKVAYFDNQKVIRCECGQNHSCAITDTNEVFMFGQNNCAQLGIGSTENEQFLPIKIGAFSKGEHIACVSLGEVHSAVITTREQASLSVDDDAKDVDENDVVTLASGESQQFAQSQKAQCLAVYIKNETIFASSAFIYVSHSSLPKS